MNQKLDDILRTLEEARRQIAAARASNSDAPDCVRTLDDVEVELQEIKQRLEKIKDRQQ
jgi:hypothetical protein